MNFFDFLNILFFLIISCDCTMKTSNLNEELLNCVDEHDYSDTHFFTEYLDKNNIKDAKLKGLVNFSNKTKFKSYSGYYTVNPKCKKNLFTWFFENENPDAPVLLWLQGGPGASSLMSLFCETGPFYVDKDLKLYENENAWTDKYSVLFVDSPVGTGFSYADNDDCYAKNKDEVSQDLYDLLKQFFTINSHLKKNDFYLTGESYGGKFATSLANKVIASKSEAQNYFNLVGIFIGCSPIDPINQFNQVSLFKSLGMVDLNEYILIQEKIEKVKTYIRNKDWSKAVDELNGDSGLNFLTNKFTGLSFPANLIYLEVPAELSYYEKLLEKPSFRQKIHVGNHTFNNASKVQSFLKEDILQSVAIEFSENIGHYKVLLYTGQLDLILGPSQQESFLSHMPWVHITDFLNAPKNIWKINEKDTAIAGYYKSYRNLTYAVVRNAGHMLSYDQPKFVLDLLTRFIENFKN